MISVKSKIALFGRSGSGKSSISSYLVSRYGYTVLSTGSICREISRLLFGNEDRRNLNILSEKLREIDPDIWIKAALHTTDDDRMIFESVRYREDISYLKPAGFLIWLIDCPLIICQERLSRRGQNFESSDLSHPMEEALRGFLFDAVINNGARPFSDVCKDVDAALKDRTT